MLLFSERGLEQFKKTFMLSDPDHGFLFDEKDAVAMPGFGALRITPATDGLTVQTEDGTNFLSIRPGNIEIKSTGDISLEATDHVSIAAGGNVSITAGGTFNARSTGQATVRGSVVLLQGATKSIRIP